MKDKKREEFDIREGLDKEERIRIDKRTSEVLENNVYLISQDTLFYLQDLISKEIAKRTLERLFWE